LAAAREAARSIQCMSNLRQDGVLMHIYRQDHNGYLVPNYNKTSSGHWGTSDNIVPVGFHSWTTELLDGGYFDDIHHMDVTRCPSLTSHALSGSDVLDNGQPNPKTACYGSAVSRLTRLRPRDLDVNNTAHNPA